jgi:hypothetical protein
MTNETKQTAVDWQFDQLSSENLLGIFTHDQMTRVMEIVEQAKAMEKQEMKHWFRGGMHLVEGSLWKPSDKFEEIYNEIYGGNK